MIGFILSLVPLAAIDASSAARPAMLALLLGAKNRPIMCGAMYVAGTYAAYMILGLIFVLGFGRVFEEMASSAGGGALHRIANPESIDYTISLIIGVLLLFAAWRLTRPPQEKKDKKPSKGFSPAGAFGLGAATNLIVGPGILPTFAAWNQVMKSSFSAPACFIILVIYNLMVVSVLIFLVVLRVVSQERADRAFAGIARFFSTWGRRIAVALFLILGLIMVVDAIGFYMGHPLLPTGGEG